MWGHLKISSIVKILMCMFVFCSWLAANVDRISVGSRKKVGNVSKVCGQAVFIIAQLTSELIATLYLFQILLKV